jgi:diguanylate cyclase (GGDEF)-like protein
MDCIVWALEAAPLSILVSTTQGLVLWANREARRAAPGLAGKNLAAMASTSGAGRIRRSLELAQGTSRPLILGLDLTGRMGLWHVWRIPPRVSGAEPVLILQEDARQQLFDRFVALKQHAHAAEDDRDRAAETARHLRGQAVRLQALMRTDRLTGVMNADGIEDFTRRVLGNRGARGVFVFADLDGFKEVNDTFGHDAGDAVLKVLAQRFAGATREGDCVARLGGDEFAFWFDGQTEDDAGRIIERLERAARQPIAWLNRAGDSVRLEVDASFGRAVAPADGCSFAELKAASDARMYESKRQKRGSPREIAR